MSSNSRLSPKISWNLRLGNVPTQNGQWGKSLSENNCECSTGENNNTGRDSIKIISKVFSDFTITLSHERKFLTSDTSNQTCSYSPSCPSPSSRSVCRSMLVTRRSRCLSGPRSHSMEGQCRSAGAVIVSSQTNWRSHMPETRCLQNWS